MEQPLARDLDFIARVDGLSRLGNVRATGVTSAFALRVSRPDGTSTTGATSVGTVDLAVTAGTGAKLISLDLELSSVPTTTCDGGGPFAMTCSP